MKKLALVAMTAAAALAAPAMAQTTTGTILITGTVASKCTVVSTSPAGSTFGTTVALGELAQADGTLATDLASRFTSIGGAGLTAKVVCTSANADVTVNADPVVSASGAGAPTGYTNTVHYKADVTFDRAAMSSLPVSNDTTAAAATATALGGRLAATATNVTVATSNWRTPNTGDLLTAGTDYQGQIVITITPA